MGDSRFKKCSCGSHPSFVQQYPSKTSQRLQSFCLTKLEVAVVESVAAVGVADVEPVCVGSVATE